MALAIVLSRWLARKEALYRRITANDFLAGLLAQVVHGIVLIAGAALALLLLDAGGLVNTLLGAAGIAGLALGFALRDTVENYIASILLVFADRSIPRITSRSRTTKDLIRLDPARNRAAYPMAIRCEFRMPPCSRG